MVVLTAFSGSIMRRDHRIVDAESVAIPPSLAT